MVAVRTRIADGIAAAVAGAGTTFAAGHPGGEVVVLMDALERRGIRFVLTHHENTAAFMACGFGELTGKPGVCVATLGPGATNMVTGIASAFLERAPVLAFTGDLAVGAPPGTTHQRLDLTALYRPVTKRSARLTAENALAEVQSAVDECRAERPGPVHLALPADIASLDASPAPAREAPMRRSLGDTARIDTAAVHRAHGLLARARKPALVAGIGALRGDASGAIAALARRLNCPVAVPPKAKGLLPEDDERFAGVIEMAGDDIVIDFLKGADLLLAVGLDVVELDKPWRLEAPIVHIDGLPNDDRYYDAEVELVGPIPPFIEALAESAMRSAWSEREFAAHHERLTSFVRPESARLQAWHVVDAVRRGLPRTAIATSDVGAHKMLVGQAWETFAPRTFFMANGLSSMGYGIPVAMAARLALPERPAVAFVGDGGLTMYLGEIETAVRLGLDLLIVVFADQRLELIRRSQVRRNVSTIGTSFSNPDFEAFAGSCGAIGYRASSRADLERSLQRALESRGVRILAVEIDGDDYRF